VHILISRKTAVEKLDLSPIEYILVNFREMILLIVWINRKMYLTEYQTLFYNWINKLIGLTH
jgi:hypothetical protein